MSLDKASMVFVSRANSPFAGAAPKFEAPASATRANAAPGPTKPSTTSDIKAAETKNADTQARVQQQAQQAQLPNLRRANTPNIFAGALVQDSKLKNALSDNLYRRNGTATAKDKRSMGTDFAGMMDQLNPNGPSDAIARMSTRMDFFEDGNTRASLS